MNNREIEPKPRCNQCGTPETWSKAGWFCLACQAEKRRVITKREVRPVGNREVRPK